MCDGNKKFLIAGYYGFKNVGDEAILSSIITSIRKQRETLDFIVLSGNPLETEEYYQVEAIFWRNIPKIAAAIQASDIVVLGGGGLFQDYGGTPLINTLLTSSHWGNSYYAGIGLLAKLYNKPFMIYSVGVGPLFTEDGKELTRLAFSVADVATVRDSKSKKLVASLGIKDEDIIVTADPALSFASTKKDARKKLQENGVKLEKNNIVGVSVRNWKFGNGSNEWRDIVAVAIDRFINKYHVQVIFIPFDARDDSVETDYEVALDIVNKMESGDKVLLLNDTYHPEMICGFIACTNFVIGMRLHSLIFATKESIPVVGLVYDPKVGSFMQSFNASDSALDIQTMSVDTLFSLIEKKWMQRNKIQKYLLATSGEREKRVQKNVFLALNLLDKEVCEKDSKVTNIFRHLAIQQIHSIEEKKIIIENQSTQLDIINNQLREIKNSKSWRLVIFLQKARAFILPSGSWRATVVRNLLFLLISPVKYLYSKIPLSAQKKLPFFVQKNVKIIRTFSFAKKKERITSSFQALKKGVAFLWHLKGVVVFGGYPYPEREKDGYFQRIKAIDTLLMSQWRIYIDFVLPEKSTGTWYDLPTEKTLVIRINTNDEKRKIAYLCMLICVFRCRTVYFHSIFAIKEFEFILNIPGINKIVDLHGVVPEELRYNKFFDRAKEYSNIERLAVTKAHYIIAVSDAMRQHIEGKYSELVHGHFIILPVFSEVPKMRYEKKHAPKHNVVYAGGLQKWQQIPKMIDIVSKTIAFCSFSFFVPDIEAMQIMLSEKGFLNHPSIIVDSKAHDELLKIYRDFDYGFILREDIIVNRVACPTKLVEYLAIGIVPIIDTENIGDFTVMGMKSLCLQDFLDGKIPNENIRTHMIQDNFIVYKKIKEKYSLGIQALLQALAIDKEV